MLSATADRTALNSTVLFGLMEATPQATEFDGLGWTEKRCGTVDPPAG